MRRFQYLYISVLALALISCGKMAPSARPAGEYVWLTRYDVKTLDPAAIQDWTTGKVLSYLYPPVGKVCEIKTDNNKVFLLKVNPSKFTNGDPVTAEDIQFTIERCLYAENQSSVGNQFAGQIVGTEGLSGDHAQGIKLESDGNLTIELKSPDQAFTAKLSNTAFGVVNHRLVGLKKPITDYKSGYGAGNWVMDSVAPGREWKLKQSTTGEILKFRYSGDSANRRSLFDTNQADYAMFAAHEAGVVQGHASLEKGGPTTLVYLQMNPKTKPQLNSELRYEIGGLIRMNLDFPMLLSNRVSRASSFLELSGTQPLPSSGVTSTKASSKASFEITYAEIGMQNPSVEAIVTALRRAGLDVRGRAMVSGAMLEKNAKGEIPMLFTGWQPDFEGPLNTIPMLFHSKSSENHSGYSNPEVDKLIDAAQRGEDTEKNIQKAYALIERDTPSVPLYIQRDLVLKRKEPPVP